MFQNLLNSMFEIFKSCFWYGFIKQSNKNRRDIKKHTNRSAWTIRTMDRTRENLDHNIGTTVVHEPEDFWRKFGLDEFVFLSDSENHVSVFQSLQWPTQSMIKIKMFRKFFWNWLFSTYETYTSFCLSIFGKWNCRNKQ